MRLAWICILVLSLYFITPSVSSMQSWGLSSLMSSFGDNFLEIETDAKEERSLSRKKRSAAIQQYTLDIEISFPDPSLASVIKNLIMNDLSYPIIIDSGTNVTGVSVTTECNKTGGNVQCSCEDGFWFPSAVCSSYSMCHSSNASNCNCITGTSDPSQYCQPFAVSIKLSLRLLQQFTSDLQNSSSTKYIQLQTQLEAQFYTAYKSLSGFQTATVKGFRAGSVITDYTVVTEPTTANDLSTANTALISNLQSSGIPVDPSFLNIINDMSSITVNPGTIFPNDTVTLVCTVNMTTYSNASWYFNDTVIQNSTSMVYSTVATAGSIQSTLTIYRAALTNIGTYNCNIDTSSTRYTTQATVNVQPLQLTVLATSVPCNNAEVAVLQCCNQGTGSPLFDLTCQVTSGSSYFSGLIKTSAMCKTYTVTANSSVCPLAGTSSFNCACATNIGANLSQSVQVTYQGSYQANITTTSDSISEGSNLTMQCNCNATSVSSMSWYLINTANNSITPTDTVSITTDYNTCLSTLTIASSITTTVSWNGTYNCVVGNGIVSASKVMRVYRLAKPSQITISPINTGFKAGDSITFSCCLDDLSDYSSTAALQISNAGTKVMNIAGNCYTYTYAPPQNSFTAYCTITNQLGASVNSNTMTLTYVAEPYCISPDVGVLNSAIKVSCTNRDPSLWGNITRTCQATSNGPAWVETSDDCVLKKLNQLNNALSELTGPGSAAQVPGVLQDLSTTVTSQPSNLTSTTQSIQTIVSILKQANTIVTEVKEATMQNFLQAVNFVVTNTIVWNNISNKVEESSSLLKSVEQFSGKLSFNDSVTITNNTNIQLFGKTLNSLQYDYHAPFDFSHLNNLTGNVSITKETLNNISNDARIVSIAYATLKDILGSNNSSEFGVLNGLVMTTKISSNLSDFKISMDFQKSNTALNNATCVFWNFNTSKWDNYGCNGTTSGDIVTCTCNHLTSFSILMSLNPPNPKEDIILTYITYIGLGISIFSLVVCIIIEITVWKSVTKNKTSYMRHICITNIAVTLLMADIWFIVGSAISDNIKQANNSEATNNTEAINIQANNAACVAATFFTNFFYLCVFFWMLTMGLILFYRLMCVFHDLSKTIMMGISFFLGYGCPLIISIVTVAVTQPFNKYRVENYCWLNMQESKAFLAFIVPALTILLINFITLLVVIVKVLRPSVGDRPKKEEKSTLNHIAKCIMILTPLLGLTWGFGIGTLIVSQESQFAINVVFSFLNSLQGFFILLFGCLMDKKVRDSLLSRFSLSRWSSQQTKTSNLSSTEPPFSKGVINLFAKRGLYNISSAQVSSSSEMASNSYSLLN